MDQQEQLRKLSSQQEPMLDTIFLLLSPNLISSIYLLVLRVETLLVSRLSISSLSSVPMCVPKELLLLFVSLMIRLQLEVEMEPLPSIMLMANSVKSL